MRKLQRVGSGHRSQCESVASAPVHATRMAGNERRVRETRGLTNKGYRNRFVDSRVNVTQKIGVCKPVDGGSVLGHGIEQLFLQVIDLFPQANDIEEGIGFLQQGCVL